MTKPELEIKLQELENKLSLVNEEKASLKEEVFKLEREKRNLVSANSDNASKYVSAKDERDKLKKENEDLKHKIRSLEQQPKPDPDTKLLAELENERRVSTEQIKKLHDFTRELLAQQGSTYNSNVKLFNYVVKDIESYQ